MNRGRAEPAYRFHMRGGGIALMARNAVAGIQAIVLKTEAISGNLGKDACGRDRGGNGIPLDNADGGDRHIADGITVYQGKIGGGTKPVDRPLHSKHGGTENIELVNLLG